MEIASLVELVVGALTGLHGVGWLMRGRWKVGLVSLGLSVLVNIIFAILILPTSGFALIPQLSLQIGWGLFSARALNDELRKRAQTPPRNAPHPQAQYPQLPPYQPPYQPPMSQRQPQPAQSPTQQPPYQPYQPPIGYAQPAPPSGQPVAPGTQRPPQQAPQAQSPQPQSPFPTPYPQDAPTWRH